MVHHDLRELTSQFPGGIYAHWSFWANAEPGMAEYAAKLIAETNGTVVRRAQSQAYKLGLFRIDTPEAFARFVGQPRQPDRPNTDLDVVLREAPRTTGGAPPTPRRRPRQMSTLYSWSRLALRTAAAAAGVEGCPTKLIFVVTKRCYSRCVYCDFWKVKDTPGGLDNELTLDEVRAPSPPRTRFTCSGLISPGANPPTGPDFVQV